jgi:hypothetical protein
MLERRTSRRHRQGAARVSQAQSETRAALRHLRRGRFDARRKPRSTKYFMMRPDSRIVRAQCDARQRACGPAIPFSNEDDRCMFMRGSIVAGSRDRGGDRPACKPAEGAIMRAFPFFDRAPHDQFDR